VVTITDVAQRAGVSLASASRVLSGRGYASPEMRGRVLAAAHEIGYSPNWVARSLRMRRTHTIALLIADIENYFYSRVAKTIETTAKRHGFHILLCNSNESRAAEREYLHLIKRLRVDGLILTPTGHNLGLLQLLIDSGVAVVQFDRKINGLRAHAVLVDNQGGAYRAVAQLIERGHRRIGLLAGSLGVTTGRSRLQGYRRALADHGIDYDPALVQSGSFRKDLSLVSARKLLAVSPPPTGLLAANNVLVEACLHVVSEAGMRVPQDISIVGFDDVPWMRLVASPLTTVDQPVVEMSRLAVTLLLEQIASPDSAAPSNHVLEPKLLARCSVASPRDPAGTARRPGV
jgi:LacI family transcriptional regulator